MRELEKQDYILIELAKRAAKVAGEGEGVFGAALRCGSGKIFTGVNIPGRYGACAEIIALGTAKASGETQLETLVTVGGKHADEIEPPCGNCRQLLLEHAPKLEVILQLEEGGAKKIKVRELLPYNN